MYFTEEQQEAGTDRPWPDPDFPEQPGAKVLEGEDVAAPGAEEPAEESSGEQCRRHEQESCRDDPELERVHDFVQLERGQCLPGDLPVHDVHAAVHSAHWSQSPRRRTRPGATRSMNPKIAP